VSVNSGDSSRLDFAITLDSDWSIPTFLANEQTNGTTTLVPIMEALCVRLSYPLTALAHSSDLAIAVEHGEQTLLSTADASFSGVTTDEVTVARITAGGVAIFGDAAASQNHGSLLVQLDLPVLPGMTVPAATEIEFPVPTVEVGAGTGVYTFTPVDDTLQCHLAGAYTDPDAAAELSMRDRFYADDMAGDDTTYTAMSDAVTATATRAGNILNYKVTLNSDWVVPAFLADEYAPQGTALSPAMQVLCVGLRYPTSPMPCVIDATAKVTSGELVFYTTLSAYFSGVSVPPPVSDVIVKRVAAGGYANHGDDETSDEVGTLYAQMTLPATPGKALPSGTEFKFTVPTSTSTDGTNPAFTAADAALKCFIGASYATSAVSHTMKGRYYRFRNGTGTLDGDDTIYSDMSDATTSTTTVDASSLTVAVSLDADWTVPAFLATEQLDDGEPMPTVVEILCVDLRYPAGSISPATDLAMSVTAGGATLLSTADATFSGVGAKQKDGVGNPSFSFLPESTEPLYVGEWSLTIAGYGLDVDADTYMTS
jgi:hypothetical protein